MASALRLVALVPAFVAAAVSGAITWSPSAAQQSPSSTANASEINSWLQEADALVRKDDASGAHPLFERALGAAQTLGLAEQEAHAHCGIADSLLGLARYADARAAGSRCLELSERLQSQQGIGRATLVVSLAAYFLGEYETSRTYAERAAVAFEASGNRRGLALAEWHLLGHRQAQLTAEERWRRYERLLEEARAVADRKLEGKIVHSWGDYLFNAGQYEESLEKLESAAEIFEALNARAPLGTVYNSLGRLYRVHGRYDEALRLQLKALEVHQQANSPFELLQSTNAVGAVYATRGELTKAREYYERALALAVKTSSPRIQDFIRANVAMLLINQGEFARGADILEEVIARKLDAYPALRYWRLAYARLKMGQIPEALAASQHAVEQCRSSTPDCVNALHQRAAVFSAAGNASAALDDVRAALASVEEMRAKLVPADFFKQDFHRAQEEVYTQAIRIQLKQDHAREALETAEQARGRAFLDLLASRNLQVAAPAAASDVASLAARLGSTFLLYWVAEDAVYIWAVGPDGRTHTRRTNVLRSKLLELVTASTPGQDTRSTKPESWRELYALLIAPVRATLPREPGALLTIVPHGPLLNLSFAALQDVRGRYLLEDFTIHYVPAAAVLQLTPSTGRPDVREGNVLLVADPPLPAQSRFDRKLPRLPGARFEAAGIGRLLPRGRQTLLQGDAATESKIREGVRGKSVLHFATHAVIRDDTPFSSFLAVGPTASNAAGDGLLTAEEIYKLDLDAGLVVLSACRSGDGPVTGDGIATFARAFMSAGTPSLVASLWGVADQPTNRLLPEFYRAWLGGQSKARALRAAQLHLLRDLRANAVRVDTSIGTVPIPEHPVFWAGFSLIGDPR